MTLCIALCDDDKIALNNELRLIKDVLNEKKIKKTAISITIVRKTRESRCIPALSNQNRTATLRMHF